MNPLYEKGKDIILIRRTSDNKEFEEFPLTLQPVSALVSDPTNDVVCVGLCALTVGFAKSASYAQTATALNALSASYANSASYSFSSSYATYASTASIALEVSSAISASYASTASIALEALFVISASYSFSASYAESASYGTNFFAPRVTSSYVSASGAIQTNQLTASNFSILRIVSNNITSSIVDVTGKLRTELNSVIEIADSPPDSFQISSNGLGELDIIHTSLPGAVSIFPGGDLSANSLQATTFIGDPSFQDNVAVWNAQNLSKSVVSVAQLANVSGSTSNIQAQLNSKTTVTSGSTYSITSSVSIVSISSSVTSVGDSTQYTPVLTLGDGNLKVAGGETSTFWFNPGSGTFSVGGTIIASTISCSAITASLSFATSSTPPLNTASVVQWIDVTLNGSTYKMPLYL